MLKISILDVSLKNTYSRLHRHLSEANELLRWKELNYAWNMKFPELFSKLPFELSVSWYKLIKMSCGPDDAIKWKHFPRYWPFVRGIHRSPVNSPHKGQWRGALMFSLIWSWTSDWVNNGEAGDLRRHRVHYDVIVMADIFFTRNFMFYWCPNPCQLIATEVCLCGDYLSAAITYFQFG